MKKEIRLYNAIFPIWFFWYPPVLAGLLRYSWAWRAILLAVLVVNFAIDSLVVCLAMKRQGLEDRRVRWKKSIWKIWGLGFLSDFIGGSFTLLLYFLINDVLHINWDVINFPGTTLIALPGVALSGVLIYFLNRRFSFKKCDLDPARVHKLSLALAVFTAPYTMLIPLYWK